MRADVQWVASGFASSTPRYGIYASYKDAANYLSVWIDPFARKLFSYGVVNGKTQAWRSAPLPAAFDPSHYHTLAVEKSGLGPSLFTLSIDWIALDKRSLSLLNGQLGLVTEDTTANYQNVTIRYTR